MIEKFIEDMNNFLKNPDEFSFKDKCLLRMEFKKYSKILKNYDKLLESLISKHGEFLMEKTTLYDEFGSPKSVLPFDF